MNAVTEEAKSDQDHMCDYAATQASVRHRRLS
jgi:hypothetical protein